MTEHDENLRVYLAKPDLTTEAELCELAHASEELHRPWAFPAKDHHEYLEFLRRVEIGRTIPFLVRKLGDDRICGVINLNEPVMGLFRSAYLGFYAAQESAGQGLISEGLCLVLDRAFSELGFHRLEANIQPGNQRSIAFVKRLGFRLEGYSPRYLLIDGDWRDHARWAMLSEYWPTARHQFFATRHGDGRQSQHG